MITTIFVADMDRAVKFYSEVLGCKIEARYGNEWAQLKTDGTTLGLHPASPENPAGVKGSIQLGIEVRDSIHDRVALMKTKGVKFIGDVRGDGQILLANFTDPDGNALYLAQQKAHWA